MPRGSLLRHLFKHGPHAKSRSYEEPPKLNGSERPAAITSTDLPRTLSPPRTPEPPTIHVLPHITEEEPTSAVTPPSSASSSTGSTVSDLASLITVLDAHAPAIDPATLITRDLLYAAIDEATTATNGHIDTLETTLALLQAITGFSETVEVLRQEMQDKKRACQTKLGELEGFEEAVEGITLPNDEARLDVDEVNVGEG